MHQCASPLSIELQIERSVVLHFALQRRFRFAAVDRYENALTAALARTFAFVPLPLARNQRNAPSRKERNRPRSGSARATVWCSTRCREEALNQVFGIGRGEAAAGAGWA